MTVAKVIEQLRIITSQCESVRRGHITAVLVKHTHRLVALSDYSGECGRHSGSECQSHKNCV